jgi:hypothetical protein
VIFRGRANVYLLRYQSRRAFNLLPSNTPANQRAESVDGSISPQVHTAQAENDRPRERNSSDRLQTLSDSVAEIRTTLRQLQAGIGRLSTQETHDDKPVRNSVPVPHRSEYRTGRSSYQHRQTRNSVPFATPRTHDNQGAYERLVLEQHLRTREDLADMDYRQRKADLKSERLQMIYRDY